jgi:hypothetical protein
MKVRSYSRFLAGCLALVTLAGATLPGRAQVLFSEDFETDTSANWSVFDGSGNGTPDFTAQFAFDYGTTKYTFTDERTGVTVTNTIPPAPNSAGGTTKGLKLTVNKNDDVEATAGVSAYPKGKNFTGNYALRCDVWINYNGGVGGGVGSTEFVTFGINHSGNEVNWTSGTAITTGSGIWFATTGEGGAAADFRSYEFDGINPVLLGTPTAGLIGADDGEQVFQDRFPYGQFETSGATGKRWVEVEVAQRGGKIIWRINGFVLAERFNSAPFDAGTIMVGTMDVFTSIANPKADNFVIFDNVRVVNLDAEPAPPTVSVSIVDGVAAEPGTDTATFTILRDGLDLSQALDVPYRLTGSATPGVDYRTNGLTGVVTIPANQGFVDLVVTPIDDLSGEPTESVILTLNGNARYEMRSDVSASVDLLDNNDTTAANVVARDAYSYERLAVDTNIFEIFRQGDVSTDLTVNFVLEGTATAGQDYNTGPTSVVIPAFETNAWVSLTPRDDAEIEGDETIVLRVLSGPGYVLGSSSNATATIRDDDLRAAPVLFEDKFDTDSSANWAVRFGANNNIEDYDALLAYDYSADGIAAAPGSGGTTRGLKISVNKRDPTASGIAGVNLYARDQSFSGDYALRFNMYLTFSTELGGTTEYSIFGINHSGNLTNRHNTAGSDGCWFAVESDGSSQGGRAYTSYLTADTNAVPTYLAKPSSEFLPYFTKPPYLGDVNILGGAASGQWVDVEVAQIGYLLSWKINGTLIMERTNTTSFTSGTIMLGHMDPFASIGSAKNFVVFDNVRVVNLQTARPKIDKISVNAQGQVVIEWTGAGTVQKASTLPTTPQSLTDVPGTSPLTVPPPASGQEYYRLKQ